MFQSPALYQPPTVMPNAMTNEKSINMTESEIKQITLTLDLVENSVKKYREIEKIKGENFNLFNILDRRTDEVKTHSAIIGELLNPKGSHYLDKTFLILFIEMLNRKKRTDNIWEKAITPKIEEIRNASVECEKSIGKVRDNTGGRLDLIISNDIFQICIENKIYAEEQDSQLERYKNFLERFPKSNNILIYLTLNGDESKTSKLVSGSDYYTLSYKYDILEWLEKCFKETVDIPILRESIKQYIILIRSLTNQITTNEMKSEIHKLILSNIDGSEKIAQEFDSAIEKVADELKELLSQILNENKITSETGSISLKKSKERFSSIWLKVKSDDKKFFGIESFNGKGHLNGSLFIGTVDFNRSDDKIKYKFHIWIDGTIEIIWDKSELYLKLQEFANGNEKTRHNIANEISLKISDYINRNY